ncbi:MAG TPA: hypothetical protein VFJ51_06785 [Nitrososphaeraceae archaeon]|nr:hypothetical protein [Nitrososphaeraceae archaeon]
MITSTKTMIAIWHINLHETTCKQEVEPVWERQQRQHLLDRDLTSSSSRLGSATTVTSGHRNSYHR